MQLTRYTDYSLRVLIFLALKKQEISTIKEIAAQFDISKNHLMKIVNHLVQSGYVKGMRGRSGGIVLARAPEEISLGEVVRKMEDGFALVACFEEAQRKCVIQQDCKLRHILHSALFAFLHVLDAYTLQDLVMPQTGLKQALGLNVR